ncbi:MAG: hypothetical protein QXS81_01200 [Candidatus Micrarchaeaceae archaeon]
MTTHKNAHKAPPSLLKDFTIPFFVILFGFWLGISLYNKIGPFGAFFIPLFIGLFLIVVLGVYFGFDTKVSDGHYGTIFFMAFIAGLFIGIIMVILIGASSHAGTSASNSVPSYYEGIVQGIGTGPNNNYVQFTSGTTLEGNVSKISNLSIGATCKLLLYQGSAFLFINGTCEK